MKYEDTEGFINYHKDNVYQPIILSVDSNYESKLDVFRGMLEDVLNNQLSKKVFKDSIQITIDKRDLSLNSFTSVKVREDETYMCFKDIDIDMLEEYLETLVYKNENKLDKPKAGCMPKREELTADTLYPMDIGLGGLSEDTSDEELEDISSEDTSDEELEDSISDTIEDKQEVIEDNEESIAPEVINKIQSIDCTISMTGGEFYDIKHLTKYKLISLLGFLDAK